MTFTNLNFTNQNEYQLNESLTVECINLYGVPVKYLITEKINRDDTVFGDYSHMKSDNANIFDLNVLPENSENWDQGGYSNTSFGLINYNNVTLFVARASFDNIPDTNEETVDAIVGNLLVFPNNKIMEITDLSYFTEGINNLYTYPDQKTVYKLTCKPYDHKLIHELDNTDMHYHQTEEYETLDGYFEELIDQAAEQDEEAEIIEQVPSVIENADPETGFDERVEKPIVDRNEDDIWGSFS
jgi:hypothetical protein